MCKKRRQKSLENKLYLKNNNKRRANTLKTISEFGIKRRIAAAIVVALVIIFQLLLQHATGPDRQTDTPTHTLAHNSPSIACTVRCGRAVGKTVDRKMKVKLKMKLKKTSKRPQIYGGYIYKQHTHTHVCIMHYVCLSVIFVMHLWHLHLLLLVPLNVNLFAGSLNWHGFILVYCLVFKFCWNYENHLLITTPGQAISNFQQQFPVICMELLCFSSEYAHGKHCIALKNNL